MPSPFEIQSVGVPLIEPNYFTNPLSLYQSISTAELLNRIVGLGANDVRLQTSFGIMQSVTSNTITPFVTQSIESLKTFTDAAHARGLDITISPIVNFAGGVISGDSTQVSHPTPADPVAWMASFRTALLEQARIAEAVGAKRLHVMGDTEQSVFEAHPELAGAMVSAINDVRQIFHGEITVNLYTNSGSLPYFPPSIIQALDYLGLGVFPVLTTKTDPTLADLAAGWRQDVDGQDIIANLGRLAASTGKPLYFGDTGQSSYDGWLRNSPGKFDTGAHYTPDNGEQVLGFQAEFDALLRYGYPWFKGLSIQNISRIVSDYGPPFIGSPVGENFYGKPAEQVIRDFYTGTATLPTLEVRGSNYGETLQGGFVPGTLIAGQADQRLNGGPVNDTFIASVPGQAVAHELKLKLTGNLTLGEMPTFTVRVNGHDIPVDYRVTTQAGAGIQGAFLSIPVLEPGRITSIELVTTNWVYEGGGINRFMNVQEITLDGANLATLHPSYFPVNSPSAPFTVAANQGGRIVYDTSSLNTTASLPVTFSSNSMINGNAGVDTVVYSGTAASYAITQTAGGWSVHKPGAAAGQGTDTLTNVEVLRFSDKSLLLGGNLDLSANTTAQSVDLAAGHTSSLTLGGVVTSITSVADGGEAHGGSAGDTLRGGALASRLFGGGGADTVVGGGSAGNYLRGDDGADSIVGGSGFDDANGNMGNDTVSTGAGDDYSVGGKDNDLLNGDAGNDIVWGNLGDDTCIGGDDNDQVRGGQGNDSVAGGAGNDFVSGDRGNDTITGGAGADNFHGSQDAGIDRVLDFSLAEGDRVQLDPGTTYTASQVGADTVLDMGGGNQMILVGVTMSTLTAGWVFGA